MKALKYIMQWFLMWNYCIMYIIIRIRIRMSFIARYVYTYEEFVLVTEAPQCNRMIATRQDTDNKKNNIQIYKIDNVQNSKKHNI